MKLLLPQATASFNTFFKEMINLDLAESFLNTAFGSYDLKNLDEVIIILLKDDSVYKFIDEYLENSNLINSYSIITLHKETSGSICTSLMAVPYLLEKSVIISALDQMFENEINHVKYIDERGDFDIIAPIYKSDDKTLCYILKDDDEKVIQLFEKKPVSNEAILGIYIIKNFSNFLEHCHNLLIRYKGFKNRIFYNSDVINSYIGREKNCYFPEYVGNYLKVRNIDDFKSINK